MKTKYFITMLFIAFLSHLATGQTTNESGQPGSDFPGMGSGTTINLVNGANSIAGSLTTPTDGQDRFQLVVPSGSEMTSLQFNFDTSGGSSAMMTFNSSIVVNSPSGSISGAPYGPGTYTILINSNFAIGNNWTVDAAVQLTTVTDPDLPTSISVGPPIKCSGNPALLSWSGSLNDATAWHIYTGSCGGTQIATTTSNSYIFTIPASGSVTYFIRGEGGGVISGSCGSTTFTVTTREDASFSYSAASYSTADTDPSPTITGVAGGTFSSTSGLSINTTTGAIDVSASTVGNYVVSYNTSGTCDGTESFNVQIISGLDDASFSYGAASYCADATDPSSTVTGETNGVFSSTAGLSINASTGAIDVSASTPGTYTVTYTTTNPGQNSSTASVTINALDNANFNYGASSYCPSDPDPTPTITGLAGGTFTSTTGLNINTNTGVVDLSSSTQGTYTITYTTNGSCVNTSNVSLSILDDVTAPVADVITLADVTAECELSTLTAPTATDNCSATVTVTNDATLPISTQGTTVVTWTYDDGNGNTSTQTQNIILNDVTPPVFTVNGATGTMSNPFTSLDMAVLTSVSSGVYFFNFNNNTFQGVLDNDTNGGGWLMVLNYVHQQNTNPDLVIRNSDLPLMGNSVLGSNEAATSTWGHMSNALAQAIDFDEIRFYGQTSGHNRIIDFSTNLTTAIEYVKNGTGSFSGINNAANYSLSAAHTSSIPQNAPDVFTNQGDLALTNFPFWRGAQAHWGIKGLGNRWEVDDFPNNNSRNTIHRVWVRANTTPFSDSITVQLDATGNVSILSTDFNINSTDNCGVVSSTLSNSTFDCSNLGDNIIQYTIADGNGNNTVLSVNVTIEDMTAPVADATTLADVTSECEVTMLTAPTATDNCVSTVTVTNDATLPISSQGTTIVTWIYDDGNGNTSTQTQNVIIDDVTAPVADATTLADVTSECQVTTLPAPTATDNCVAIVTVTNDATLPISAQGTTVVTWTYDDGNGNTSTQTQNVIIDDVTAPVADATTLADVTSECQVATLTAPTATDNCTATVTVSNDATLPISTQGTTVVTWTYDDGNGNTSTQTQNVIIDDVTAPIITCTSNITQVNDAGDCGAVVNYTTPIVSDNCVPNDGDILINGSFEMGDFTGWTVIDFRIPFINYSVTNSSNNSFFSPTTATDGMFFAVNGFDSNSGPDTSLLYQEVNIPVGIDNAQLSWDENIDFDLQTFCNNCSNRRYEAQILDTSNNVLEVLKIYVAQAGTIDNDNVFVSEIADLTSYAGQTIRIGFWQSTPDPSSGPGRFILDNVNLNISSNSNLSVIQTAGLASGSTFPVGTTTNTFSVTDAGGNASTCSFDVVVTDSEAPVADATALMDVTAECEVTTLTAPTATDNCATTVTVTNDATLPISTQGTTVVTWTYDDGNGNTSTQTQNVIIDDVTAPVVTCLSDVLITCSDSAVVNYVLPTVTDNCSLQAREIGADFTSLGNLNGKAYYISNTPVSSVDAFAAAATNGYNLVTINNLEENDFLYNQVSSLGGEILFGFNDVNSEGTFVWQNGSTSTYTNWNTFEPNNANEEDYTGFTTSGRWNDIQAQTLVRYLIEVESFSINQTAGLASGSTFPVGTTTNSFTITDRSGNTTSCSFDVVIVADTTAPVADVATLTDVTAECEVTSLIAPTATDDCATTVTVTNDATLPISGEGTTTVVTWTYDDGNGNTSTQTQNVIIDDVTAPVADATTLMDITAECEVTSLTAPTATDNCVATVTVTNDATLPISGEGTTTVVTWTYDDGNGNTSMQTQNVIIDDVTAPVADATALTDVTAECEVTSLTAPTATDNCATTVTVTNDATLPISTQGTTVVTWTYDDGNGNTSTQTQNVIIDDVTLPVANAASLPDLIFNCEVTSLTAPTATDNCVGIVTGTATFPITSTTVVSWQFDDGNGNVSSQDQLVIIEQRAIDAVANVTVCDSFTLATITGDYLTGSQMYYTQGGGNGIAFAEADTINFSDFASYPVTLYAYDTDMSGCSAQTSFQLTITETPVINPIMDVTACDEYVLPVLSVGSYYSFPGGNGSLLNAGTVIDATQTIFVYAEDVSGNCTDQETFTVTILPLDDASFNYNATTYCPNAIDPTPTITGLVGGTFTSTTGLIIDAATGSVDLDTSMRGTYLVTYTTNGDCPQSTMVSFTIEDNVAPTPDVTVLADVVAECEVTTLVAPTATDDCSAVVTVTNDAIFPITGEGTTTVVTWTYDDGNGNTSTQTQNVIIDDVTAPVANATILTDVTAECEVTSLAAPAATDNCANATVVVSNDAIFPITGEGTTTVVTWTYDDGNGNTSTQTQNVIIDDVTAPVANVATLTDVIAECEVTSLVAPAATDNCANATVTVSNDAIFPISGEGTTTVVTWTYDDGNGNTSTQTQNVIIDDVTAPVANVATLTDVIAECEVTSLVAPAATDNCANAIVTVSNDAIFPISGEGTTTVVTWTYDDGNGNTSTQTQNVIIDDVTAPVANVATLTDVVAECEVTSLVAPAATDSCANATVTVSNDAIFPISGEGTTTVVTWTYDDGNGNTSTQTQNVIIDDVTAPVADVASLPTLNFNCEVTALTAPTSTDNCAGSITATNTVIFPLTSSTLVNWSYDDGNGNVSSQDQLVVVELRAMDAISDVTVCDTYTLPNISGDFLTGSQMYYTQSGGNGIAFAEADVLNHLDFAVYPVTLYAYDVDAATGCSAETSFLLTINESPVISPIADVTICDEYMLPVLSVGDYYTFPGGNGTLINAGTVIDATQTIFVYAEDASGSCTDETSFVISVTPSDILGATFNDASFTYDGSAQSISVENIPATATVVYTNNDQVDAGTYTVTATVTSATSSCNPIVLTATMVINRAPQTITFDSLIRRRLNVDPDFQLTASSTSGLPVAYSFSFTGATAAATVSNTGFVNLLAEGEILISASQTGNANYLPASVVQQTLEVYLGDNADLDAVTIDGTVTNNPASEIYYLIDCGSGTDSVEVNLSNSDGATFTPGATFSIATPRPGIYTQEVTVTADNGRNTRSYIITVERRFEFDEIVEQKYNNTLVVNNNFDNNGGYNFVSYEWFKNGRLVSTEQFFSEGDNASDLLDPTASYYVRMTTDAGEVLQTCISSVSLGNTFSLTVLENPVIQGRLLQVRADYPAAELDHAMYQIYSAHGQFIKAVSVQGLESQIRLSESLPVGLYRLVLITSQRTESVNFIKN